MHLIGIERDFEVDAYIVTRKCDESKRCKYKENNRIFCCDECVKRGCSDGWTGGGGRGERVRERKRARVIARRVTKHIRVDLSEIVYEDRIIYKKKKKKINICLLKNDYSMFMFDKKKAISIYFNEILLL